MRHAGQVARVRLNAGALNAAQVRMGSRGASERVRPPGDDINTGDGRDRSLACALCGGTKKVDDSRPRRCGPCRSDEEIVRDVTTRLAAAKQPPPLAGGTRRITAGQKRVGAVRLQKNILQMEKELAGLGHGPNGTRWTNEQLLFHMLFGYLIVRALLPLVRVFSRLPDNVGRIFAYLLNAASRPFDIVNYLGSCIGAIVFNRRRMGTKLDRVIVSLHRSLDAETEERLRRAMAFPARWDPYFEDTMTLADVYQYATQHFDHHRRQLTNQDGRSK